MAQTESEMMAWIEALNKAVAAALTDLKSSGSTAKELIQRIYEEPSNAYCADCNAPGNEHEIRLLLPDVMLFIIQQITCFPKAY